MEKKITTRTTPLMFFRQYLKLINPLYRLSPKESEVLSYLLYLNYKYRDITEDARHRLIFDYDSKVLIANEFKTSMAKINNVLTDLRKKSYQGQSFVLGKKLNFRVPLLPTLTENKMNLNFEFIIND